MVAPCDAAKRGRLLSRCEMAEEDWLKDGYGEGGAVEAGVFCRRPFAIERWYDAGGSRGWRVRLAAPCVTGQRRDASMVGVRGRKVGVSQCVHVGHSLAVALMVLFPYTRPPRPRPFLFVLCRSVHLCLTRLVALRTHARGASMVFGGCAWIDPPARSRAALRACVLLVAHLRRGAAGGQIGSTGTEATHVQCLVFVPPRSSTPARHSSPLSAVVTRFGVVHDHPHLPANDNCLSLSKTFPFTALSGALPSTWHPPTDLCSVCKELPITCRTSPLRRSRLSQALS